MNRDSLIIFDTTLRDGEQSPGASMTMEEKVRIARQLDRLKVDVIEAGFPIASIGDFESVCAVTQVVRDSTVCALARAQKDDIDRAGEALKGCKKARIHTFISTSPLHMERKLRMSPDEVVDRAIQAVRWAKNYTDDVEFSAEDAARSEIEFLCRIFSEVIKVGATTINVPDTVGYCVPEHYAALMKAVMDKTVGGNKVVWSTHCHNDLGLAVANSLAAVQVGARQVECTINGLGERAGNAALEEIVMTVRTRQDIFNCTTHIDATHIVPTSKLVSAITGFPVQPNKAVVGANAFAHASGIHQDGVLKHRETYEIMKAEDVGWRTNQLILSKHSGRNAFRSRLESLGIPVASDEHLNHAFARFKELADKKREIFDEDLQALMSQEEGAPMREHYQLVWMRISSEIGEMARAQVILNIDGQEKTLAAEGGGPVDATFQAIQQMTGSTAMLTLYSVNAITGGTDAQGEVTVRLEYDDQIVNGQGADTDIVVASAKAYLNALNRMAAVQVRLNPQGVVI